MRERHVGISLGLIDSLSDGLGEFSTQIGERIAAAAPHWRAAYGVRFHFHLHERWHGHFGFEHRIGNSELSLQFGFCDRGQSARRRVDGGGHVLQRRQFAVRSRV